MCQVVLHAIESEDSIAQRLRGHDALDLDGLRKTAHLVVSEKECLILNDRTADRHSTAIVMLRCLGV